MSGFSFTSIIGSYIKVNKRGAIARVARGVKNLNLKFGGDLRGGIFK
jgi:hypothetical protein